jgi:hypothetical protein
MLMCVCIYIYIPFVISKQVLDLFKILIKFLRNKFEFVVQPTLHDGMNVGTCSMEIKYVTILNQERSQFFFFRD